MGRNKSFRDFKTFFIYGFLGIGFLFFGIVFLGVGFFRLIFEGYGKTFLWGFVLTLVGSYFRWKFSIRSRINHLRKE